MFFNPHKLDYRTGNAAKYDKDGRPDMDDKSGGIERFIIGTPDYYELNPIKEESIDIFSNELTYEEEE